MNIKKIYVALILIVAGLLLMVAACEQRQTNLPNTNVQIYCLQQPLC